MSKKPPKEASNRPQDPNPFLYTLRIPVFQKLLVTEIPDTWAGSRSYRVQPIETDARVSLYIDNIMPLLKELTPSAVMMVLYIMEHLSPDKDYLELREDKYCQEMGITRATYHAARMAITNMVIIPRVARKHTYWINPALFFRGDRRKKYPEKMVAVNDNPLAHVEAHGTLPRGTTVAVTTEEFIGDMDSIDVDVPELERHR